MINLYRIVCVCAI